MPASGAVVVGFDFGHSSELALARAVALVANDESVTVGASGYPLHVVCVLGKAQPVRAVPGTRLDRAYIARVRTAIAGRIDPRARFFIHVRVGVRPAATIVAIAEDVCAERIIVGSRGVTGLERLLVGSTSERVVRDARCTVEVVRAPRSAWL